MADHKCPGDECRICEARIDALKHPEPLTDWESDSIADDYYQALENTKGGRHRA